MAGDDVLEGAGCYQSNANNEIHSFGVDLAIDGHSNCQGQTRGGGDGGGLHMRVQRLSRRTHGVLGFGFWILGCYPVGPVGTT